MRLFRLESRQRLAIGIDEAWAFFSDPRNLREITPESLDFQVTTAELPERIHPGLIVTYRVRPLLGLPVSWVTEITHVVEGRLFVDEQRFGPYRFWHHQHHFRETEGGVEVSDLVHYALPRPGSRAIERLVVGPRLKEIFGHRRRVLSERFGEIG